jgi:hypothetical protein
MKVSNDAKSLIGNTYPGYDEIIEHGFHEYPAFRDLCEDYRSCAIALEGWRKQGRAADEERAHEYEELLADLALEIEGWLAFLKCAGRLRAEEGVRGKSS